MASSSPCWPTTTMVSAASCRVVVDRSLIGGRTRRRLVVHEQVVARQREARAGDHREREQPVERVEPLQEWTLVEQIGPGRGSGGPGSGERKNLESDP